MVTADAVSGWPLPSAKPYDSSMGKSKYTPSPCRLLELRHSLRDGERPGRRILLRHITSLKQSAQRANHVRARSCLSLAEQPAGTAFGGRLHLDVRTSRARDEAANKRALDCNEQGRQVVCVADDDLGGTLGEVAVGQHADTEVAGWPDGAGLMEWFQKRRLRLRLRPRHCHNEWANGASARFAPFAHRPLSWASRNAPDTSVV